MTHVEHGLQYLAYQILIDVKEKRERDRKQTDAQRDKQADMHTDKQMEGQETESSINVQTDRQLLAAGKKAHRKIDRKGDRQTDIWMDKRQTDRHSK